VRPRARRTYPFGTPYTPLNPRTGKFFAATEGALARLAEITAETGAGVYTWKTYGKESFETGSAKELSDLVGVPVGTRVVLHRDVDDIWYFEYGTASVPSVVLATITGETGSGVYTWATFGAGDAETGSATELNLSTGIVNGTVVVLHQDADDTYYFFFPVETCN